MTRYFCGMWQYETQIMDYMHTESFLARLMLKKRSFHVCICDKQGNAIAGVIKDAISVYNFNNRLFVSGLVLYDTHYRVKVDSFENVSLVPIH